MSTGCLIDQELAEKLKNLGGGPQDKIFITECSENPASAKRKEQIIKSGRIPITLSGYSPTTYNGFLAPEALLHIAIEHKPAFIIFDLFKCLPFLKHETRLKKFTKEAKALNTAFIGLKSRAVPRKIKDILKAVTALRILKRGRYYFLHKRTGFMNSPNGVLRFQMDSKGIQDLSYWDKGLSDIENSQADLFMEVLNKFGTKPIFTNEVKDKARKAGVSTYFLKNINWPDYGYQAEGQGYGADYRQVIVPFRKH